MSRKTSSSDGHTRLRDTGPGHSGRGVADASMRVAVERDVAGA